MARAVGPSYPQPTMNGRDRTSRPPDGGDAPGLGEALASPDAAVRAQAILAAPTRPGAEEVLLRALEDEAAEVRRAAVLALARVPTPTATRSLLRAVGSDPSPTVRAEAVAALGRILASRMPEDGGEAS